MRVALTLIDLVHRLPPSAGIIRIRFDGHPHSALYSTRVYLSLVCPSPRCSVCSVLELESWSD